MADRFDSVALTGTVVVGGCVETPECRYRIEGKPFELH